MKVTLCNNELKQAVVRYLEEKFNGEIDIDGIELKLRRKSSKNEEVGVAEITIKEKSGE